jgi:hypothetical protein
MFVALLNIALGVGVASLSHQPIVISGFSGCTNTAINVATNCEIKSTQNSLDYKYIYPESYHAMILYVYFARGGGTGYTFQLQACIEGMRDTDCTDSTDWYAYDAQTASTNYTDIEPKIYRRTVSANSYDTLFVTNGHRRVRLYNILCTGGGCSSSDKITVKALLHPETLEVIP